VTRIWRGSLVIGFALISLPAPAHHSFAIYDMEQNIVFDGVVETLKMRNPHIALTLTVTKGDGTQGTVNFVEGAPANMLVRRGLNPADIAVGKPIRAIGAPLHEDPNAFFLKAVILPDGRRFVFVGGE
jgi:hypothetical protein